MFRAVFFLLTCFVSSLAFSQTPAIPSMSVTGVENAAAGIDTDGTFTFSWPAVANAEAYGIERSGGVVYWGAATSYKTENLGFGTYTFRIRACRSGVSVCSSYSSAITITIKYPPPPQPGGITFTNLENAATNTDTNGAFTINWGVSTSIEAYSLEQNGNVVHYDMNRSYSASNLPPGTYTYRVRGCRDWGTNCSTYTASQTVTVVDPNAPPPVPVLSAAGVENTASNIDTNGTITFSWGAVAGAEAYSLEQDGNAIYYGTGTSFTVQNLVFGAREFRVRACKNNAAICSSYSNVIKITVQYPQPTLPSGPTFSGLENAAANTDSNGTFTISWGESVGSEAYLLKRNGADWYWGPNRTYSESGLPPGAYTYQVRGCRDWATNCSAYTASITITVAAPASSSSSRSSSSIAITSASSSRSSSSVAITSASASRSSSSVAITSTSTSRSSSSAPLISSSSSSRSSSSASTSAVAIQPKITRYTYDALGRLTFVEDAQNGNRDYDYDAAGNRLLVSTAVTSDTTAEPNVLLPAPTNLYKSLIYSCAWKATWNPVTGAAKYLVKDSSGASQTVTTAEAVVACPVGNSSGNMPQSVQACTANNVCGTKAYF